MKRDLSTPLAETFPTKTKTKTKKSKTITKTKTKKGGYVTKTKKVDGKVVKNKSRKTIQKAYIDAEFRLAERKKARVKEKEQQETLLWSLIKKKTKIRDSTFQLNKSYANKEKKSYLLKRS